MCVSDCSSADITTKPVLIFVNKSHLPLHRNFSFCICLHTQLCKTKQQTNINKDNNYIYSHRLLASSYHFWCLKQLTFLSLIPAKENHISYNKIVRNN